MVTTQGSIPLSEAWEFFGEANGAASIEQMRARVGRYRCEPLDTGEDPIIGCLFIRDTCFFRALDCLSWFPNVCPTAPTWNSWNGTSTKYSWLPDQIKLLRH